MNKGSAFLFWWVTGGQWKRPNVLFIMRAAVCACRYVWMLSVSNSAFSFEKKKTSRHTHTSTIRPPTIEPGSAEDAAETQALYVRSTLWYSFKQWDPLEKFNYVITEENAFTFKFTSKFYQSDIWGLLLYFCRINWQTLFCDSLTGLFNWISKSKDFFLKMPVITSHNNTFISVHNAHCCFLLPDTRVSLTIWGNKGTFDGKEWMNWWNTTYTCII